MPISGPMIFKTLRALSGVSAADSAGPPAASSSSWVVLGAIARHGTIEVRWGEGSVTGAPTSVQLSLWRKVTPPDVGGTPLVDRLLTKTILLADIAQPLPDVVDAYGNEFVVTLDSFSGGTAPALTLNVQARFVKATP